MIFSFIYFIKAMLFFSFVGYGIYGFLHKKLPYKPPGMIIALGYAFSITIWFPLYFILDDSPIFATIAILIFSLLLNIAYFWRYKFNKVKFKRYLKINKYAYFVFLIIVSFSSITYLYNVPYPYWHSANEDTFDGLNGKNAYLLDEFGGYYTCRTGENLLQQTYENKEDIKMEDRVDCTYVLNLQKKNRFRDEYTRSVHEQAGVTTQFKVKDFVNLYSKDPGALQYSSLALISVIIGIETGMHAFIIQSLINLGLFGLGMYTITKHFFRRNLILATSLSCFTVISNFYFNTYLNGHIGSMMYMSISLFAIALILKTIVSNKIPWQRIIILLLFGIFLYFSYPYPLVYIIPIILGFAILNWYSKFQSEKNIAFLFLDWRFILLAIITMLITYYFAYDFGEYYRIRNETKFRSWGTTFTYVGFLQFWGLFLSDLANARSPLMWVEQQDLTKQSFFALGLLLTAVSFYGFYKLFNAVKGFLLVFIPALIFFFIIMRFAIVDTYYMYKFYYVHQWVIFLCTFVGFYFLIKNKYTLIKYLSSIIGIVWISFNLLNNYTSLTAVASHEYNSNPLEYNEILQAPREKIALSVLDIPQQDHADVVKQIFNERKIDYLWNKGKAKYLVKIKGMNDIFESRTGKLVWESASGKFQLFENTESDIVQVAAFFPPEGGFYGTRQLYKMKSFIIQFILRMTGFVYEGYPLIRWVSDAHWSSFHFDVSRRSKNSNYFKFCAFPGPGIDRRSFDLHLYDANKLLIKTFRIDKQECHEAFIGNYKAPFYLDHNEKANYFSAVDRRRLVYAINKIEFSDTSGTEQLFYSLLGRRDDGLGLGDIIDDDNNKIDSEFRLRLGDNWHLYEGFNGAYFRWGKENAEIIISSPVKNKNLTIHAASGPSGGVNQLIISLIDEMDNIVGKCILDKPKKCQFNINHSSDVAKYRIQSNGKSIRFADDPRIFNFRVFGISLKNR